MAGVITVVNSLSGSWGGQDQQGPAQLLGVSQMLPGQRRLLIGGTPTLTLPLHFSVCVSLSLPLCPYKTIPIYSIDTRLVITLPLGLSRPAVRTARRLQVLSLRQIMPTERG